MNSVLEKARNDKDYLVALRREFHASPELSLEEKETSNKIKRELDKMGIDYVVVGDYGIVATIEGKNKDKMIALRADIDALPIKEENNISYKSKNDGVMHACGHDAHAAMLLGAAKILKELKNELNGSVKLCFQQAEELGKCHDDILNELSKYPIKSVFATHVWSSTEIGKVILKKGAMMAASDIFRIDVQGKGAHGACPEDGVSPIIVAASIALNISVARAYEIDQLEPAVITLGCINSGAAANIIPDTAFMLGTIRTFTEKTRTHMMSMLERIVVNNAKSFNATAKVTYLSQVDAVINDDQCTDIARKSLKSLLGDDAIHDTREVLGSENFGSYLKVYPGVIAMIGSKNSSIECDYAHHHPRFNIDEDALPIGTALYTQYAIDALNKL